ncbi:MAG TPA: BON domain-containing protein, partial [Polyangiales bacterium]|nr:BON domain-containing protein [Polyangiales bacterium]
ANRDYSAGRDSGSSRNYASNRDYTTHRDYGTSRDYSASREEQHRPQYGDYERSYGWSHSQRGAEDRDYRGSGERQWGNPRYRADNDYARDEDHESFGHQLREAGQKIARSVKRAFRGPKGYKRSDDRIRDDVSDRLGENPWLDCSEVEVTVSNGEVTLTGSVNSRQEKFLLEEIADDVSGVNEVHNQVRVKREQQQQSSLAMAETAPGTQTSAEVAARARNARA